MARQGYRLSLTNLTEGRVAYRVHVTPTDQRRRVRGGQDAVAGGADGGVDGGRTGTSRMKVYADHNVVSALRRWDQRPEENAAIRTLREWSDNGQIALVVSAVHDREAAVPEQYREAQAATLALLPRVEFADDHQLRGFNTILSGRGGRSGFVTYPLFEDDTIARRLREVGLDRLDAHHVMLAIRRQCDVFITCDERTILRHRTEIGAEFSIRLLLPSELVREILAAHP